MERSCESAGTDVSGSTSTDKVLPPVKKAGARQNQAQRMRARPHALTRRCRRAKDEGRTKYHRSCSRTPRPMHNHIAPWQVSWLSGRRPLRPSRHQASGCQAADSPITVAGAATAWMERPSLCRSLFIPAVGQETARQSQYSGPRQPPWHAVRAPRAPYASAPAAPRTTAGLEATVRVHPQALGRYALGRLALELHDAFLRRDVG